MSTEDKVKVSVTEECVGSTDIVYFLFGKSVVAAIVDDIRCSPQQVVNIYTLGGPDGYMEEEWRFETVESATIAILDYLNAEVG